MNKTVQAQIPDPSLYEPVLEDLKVLRDKYPSLRDDELLMILVCRARFYTSVEVWSEHVIPETRLPPFAQQGLCNAQLSRADSDLCVLKKGHKEPCQGDR